jgi:hypothetical protein
MTRSLGMSFILWPIGMEQCLFLWQCPGTLRYHSRVSRAPRIFKSGLKQPHLCNGPLHRVDYWTAVSESGSTLSADDLTELQIDPHPSSLTCLKWHRLFQGPC